jgi:uncharacterized protein
MTSKISLFPLSQSLLLPYLSLPYHIFEPRYRTMLENSLNDFQPISVVLDSLYPFVGAKVYAGQPKILHRHADGRSDIVITGEHRYLIKRLIEKHDYLEAEVDEIPLPQDLTRNSSFEVSCLREAIESWLEVQRLAEEQIELIKKSLAPEPLVISYAANIFVKDASQRNLLLEADTWDDMAHIVVKNIGPRELSLGPYLGKINF